MKIVALGNEACVLANKLTEYPVYDILYLDEREDEGLPGTKIDVDPQLSPEQYEEHSVNVKEILKGEKEITFIIMGGTYISGMTLSLMEQVKNKILNVLYVQPDPVSLMDETARKQDRVAFNVLQQFARSGLLSNMKIVSHQHVVQSVGNIPIIGYKGKLNEAIIFPFHMINVYNNTKSLMGNMSYVFDTARISTFGTFDYETGNESLYFPLDNAREKRYYYGVPKKILEEDTELLTNIRKQLESKSEAGKVKVTYEIYETEYDEIYGYVEAFSSHIQSY